MRLVAVIGVLVLLTPTLIRASDPKVVVDGIRCPEDEDLTVKLQLTN